MYIGKSHAKHAYTSHIYCCALASPTEVCPSPDATPYSRYHAVRVHLRAPASTHTEFYQLAHNTNTSRCKMCNTGSKCKFVSCIEQKLLQTWSGHDKSSFYLPEGPDRILVGGREEYISNRYDFRVRRLKNLAPRCQKVSKLVGNQPWTRWSAPLWTTKQDYSRNSFLYGSKAGRRCNN